MPRPSEAAKLAASARDDRSRRAITALEAGMGKDSPIEFELARSLWLNGGDHERAHALAHDARAKLIAIGNMAGTPDELRDLDAWLATHH